MNKALPLRFSLFICLSIFPALWNGFAAGDVYAASVREQEQDDENELNITEADLGAWKNVSRRVAERYPQLLREISTGKTDIAQAMRGLRSYYPRLPQYDPFAKRTIEALTQYAYTADMSQDTEEVNEALAEYRDVLYAHLANLDVVEYALTLARADVRFGDEFFLKKARDAIRQSWDAPREWGMRPDDAYQIVTFGEESYILAKLGVTVENSEIYQVEKRLYNVHEVASEDGKQHYQLYFDVTQPIRNIKIMQMLREKETQISIPLQ